MTVRWLAAWRSQFATEKSENECQITADKIELTHSEVVQSESSKSTHENFPARRRVIVPVAVVQERHNELLLQRIQNRRVRLQPLASFEINLLVPA